MSVDHNLFADKVINEEIAAQYLQQHTKNADAEVLHSNKEIAHDCSLHQRPEDFYERQFITRKHVNSDILSHFENLLDDYFKSDLPQKQGLPSVKYCADKLYLSTNYLGDLIKKETGKSAQEHVQLRLIEIAKEKMFEK